MDAWSGLARMVLKLPPKGRTATAPSLCRPGSGTGSWCALRPIPGQGRTTMPQSPWMSSVGPVWIIQNNRRGGSLLLIQRLMCCFPLFLLSDSQARDPQSECPRQWNLRSWPLPGPLCTGAIQPTCQYHLHGQVWPAGGQHLWLRQAKLRKLPLADQSHAEDYA